MRLVSYDKFWLGLRSFKISLWFDSKIPLSLCKMEFGIQNRCRFFVLSWDLSFHFLWLNLWFFSCFNRNRFHLPNRKIWWRGLSWPVFLWIYTNCCYSSPIFYMNLFVCLLLLKNLLLLLPQFILFLLKELFHPRTNDTFLLLNLYEFHHLTFLLNLKSCFV